MSKRNLPFADKLKLVTWLTENVESLHRKTDASVAADASSSLGMAIKHTHVRGIRIDVNVPVSWEPAGSGGPRASNRKVDCALAGAINVLFAELGIADKRPPAFVALMAQLGGG